MKRHILPLLLSLVVAPVLAMHAATQTVDEVVEKHLAAMGGREALGKLTTRKGTGTVTFATPNGDISGPVELYSKVPNKVRGYMVLDLTPMGAPQKMVIEQKFDGVVGWSLNSLQGDLPITGNQLDNMKGATFPNPLLAHKTNGSKVELLPNETLAGKSAIVLRITPKVGSASKLYLDASTYLAMRSVSMVNIPTAGGDVEQVAEAMDFRKVDGVMVPFKTIQVAGPQKVTIVLTKVEHNVLIDDAMFSKK